MKCPYCHYHDSKVVDSRTAEERAAIRRRRECLECGRRFTTYETVEEMPLMVVKKDGRREMFDRTKVLNGMLKACEKRPVSVAVLEQAIDAIEKELKNSLEREVRSGQIGEMVMDKLADIDEIAYIRFASVYRQFTDLNKFRQELEALLSRQHKEETKA